MTTNLDGKNALVTGGGVGIGKEIALELARAGAQVAVTYLSHEPDDDFAREVKEASGHALITHKLDVTNEEQVRRVLDELAASVGSIDVLVNNAGGLVERQTIADMDPALWRTVMAVNLDSTFLVTHYCLAHMDTGWGRIVNVASLAGFNGGHPGAVAYAASKSAIFGFTRGLSRELAAQGITVNAVAPGFIEATPFHDTFTTAESKATTISTIPVQRAGVPADVASAVAWLASPSAGFTTGTTVSVNGGQYFA